MWKLAMLIVLRHPSRLLLVESFSIWSSRKKWLLPDLSQVTRRGALLGRPTELYLSRKVKIQLRVPYMRRSKCTFRDSWHSCLAVNNLPNSRWWRRRRRLVCGSPSLVRLKIAQSISKYSTDGRNKKATKLEERGDGPGGWTPSSPLSSTAVRHHSSIVRAMITRPPHSADVDRLTD